MKATLILYYCYLGMIWIDEIEIITWRLKRKHITQILKSSTCSKRTTRPIWHVVTKNVGGHGLIELLANNFEDDLNHIKLYVNDAAKIIVSFVKIRSECRDLRKKALDGKSWRTSPTLPIQLPLKVILGSSKILACGLIFI